MDTELRVNKSDNPPSNLQNKEINFGKIEVVEKIQTQLERYLDDHKFGVKELSSLKDINTLLDQKYYTKILNKKIKRILDYEEYKLYFKLDLIPSPNEDIDLEEGKEDIKERKDKESGKEDNIQKKKSNINNLKNDQDNIKNDFNKDNLDDLEKFDSSKNKENQGGISLSFTSSDFEINSILSSLNKSNNDSLDSSNVIKDKEEKNFTNYVIKVLESKDEDIITGHDYEGRAKKYFQAYLDFCSEQDLKIDYCSTKTIKCIYKSYEDLLKNDEKIRNKNITGDSQKKNCQVGEFELLIDNIDKTALLNIIKEFKLNVSCNSDFSNLKKIAIIR